MVRGRPSIPSNEGMYVSEGFWRLVTMASPVCGYVQIPEDDENWIDDFGFDSLLARFNDADGDAGRQCAERTFVRFAGTSGGDRYHEQITALRLDLQSI